MDLKLTVLSILFASTIFTNGDDDTVKEIVVLFEQTRAVYFCKASEPVENLLKKEVSIEFKKQSLFIENFQMFWNAVGPGALKESGAPPFSGGGDFLLYNHASQPIAFLKVVNGTNVVSIIRVESKKGAVISMFSESEDPVIGHIESPLLVSLFLDHIYHLAVKQGER